MVILFDIFNLPSNIFEIIFATKSQKIVGELLIKLMREKGGEITKTVMRAFATELHEGKFETVIDEEPYFGKKERLSYNKRQFYARILIPLKGRGLKYYDLYKKTYKLSSRFSEEIQKISIMWKQELKKGQRIKTFI